MQTMSPRTKKDRLEYRQIVFKLDEKKLETHGTLTFATYSKNEKFLCMMFRGTSAKSTHHYSFKSPEALEKWIKEQKESEDRSQAFQNERKGKDSDELESMKKQLTVGSLLYSSWGYDQTRVYYYQVVSRSSTGATIGIREIEKKSGEGGNEDQGYWRVKPCPDKFIGPEMKKRVNSSGVRIASYANAWPCSVDAEHSESGYH